MDKQNTLLCMEYYLEALAHELSLRKAEPPLFVHGLESSSGSVVGMVELTFEGPTPPGYILACKRMAISCRTWEMYLQSQSVAEFIIINRDDDIRSQSLCILTVPRGLKSLVERERHITGNCEMVKGNVDHGLVQSAAAHENRIYSFIYLLCIPSRRVGFDLPQTFADKQRPVDKHTVRGSINFEVAEEDIGPEQRENLIDAVVRLAVGGHIDIKGTRRERGECVCGAARASPEREDGEVSWQRAYISKGVTSFVLCAEDGSW